MQQQLGTSAAVTSRLMVVQFNFQVFAQSIQPMVGQIWETPPSHLAGAGIDSKLPPTNSVCIQAFGQYAHIKGGIMCYQYPTIQNAPQSRPHIWKGRCIRYGFWGDAGELNVKAIKINFRIDER